MSRASILTLFGIELPIVQSPMAGVSDHELAIAVARAGGLGSLACGALSPDAIRDQVTRFRNAGARPINLNFLCHQPPAPDPERDARWRARLTTYYTELGLDPNAASPSLSRAPFDDASCTIVEELRPEVVSFHFGLPPRALLDRVRATGAKILSSATTVSEARYLEDAGCDAVIAQGADAGGHRAMFLTTDASAQVGSFALIPQIVDAVKLPVIAAGAIADARGIVAAFALGAAGVQIGTAYLRCPEARTTALHRAALANARDDSTRITNVITGRPARGLANRLIREQGPLRDDLPAFPNAALSIAPLRAAAEARGLDDFSTMLAGQAAPLAREVGATELTLDLAREMAALMRGLAR